MDEAEIIGLCMMPFFGFGVGVLVKDLFFRNKKLPYPIIGLIFLFLILYTVEVHKLPDESSVHWVTLFFIVYGVVRSVIYILNQSNQGE
jgi:uncharacterized membrane protein YoaK (UPF0700 family)